MNRFYAIGLLALFAIIATSGNAASVNVCEGVSDNIFIADVTNCTNYYYCNNGQAIAQQCRDSLYFNAASQSCVATSSGCLTCDKDVLNSTALIKTCNKYVLCFAGTPVLQQCADNLQYNPNLRACDLPRNVDCVADRCSIYQDPQNIVYVPSVSACNRYFICMNGLPQNQSCISGLYFSSDCNCCDLPVNVNCTIPRSSSRTVSLQTAAMIAPRMVDIKCPIEGIHFLAHRNPNQYFMCVNGKGALMTCAASLYFDKEVGACRRLEDIQTKH
ncbi:PREDICTED: peritrophin-44-like [Rhagoletis zephyria]|uniref:peritrophin-44-like n=1 Tax=Rhagoletis zephyria TaxID=28612 RepID=UPI00081138FA|nr:PREDICTED: peritrophin-44-like [Rhagoletis zephyria]